MIATNIFASEFEVAARDGSDVGTTSSPSPSSPRFSWIILEMSWAYAWLNSSVSKISKFAMMIGFLGLSNTSLHSC